MIRGTIMPATGVRVVRRVCDRCGGEAAPSGQWPGTISADYVPTPPGWGGRIDGQMWRDLCTDCAAAEAAINA